MSQRQAYCEEPLILGLNAAKLLKIKGLASMGAPVSAGKAVKRRAKR